MRVGLGVGRVLALMVRDTLLTELVPVLREGLMEYTCNDTKRLFLVE